MSAILGEVRTNSGGLKSRPRALGTRWAAQLPLSRASCPYASTSVFQSSHPRQWVQKSASIKSNLFIVPSPELCKAFIRCWEIGDLPTFQSIPWLFIESYFKRITTLQVENEGYFIIVVLPVLSAMCSTTLPMKWWSHCTYYGRQTTNGCHGIVPSSDLAFQIFGTWSDPQLTLEGRVSTRT